MTQLTNDYIVRDSNNTWDAGLNRDVRSHVITMDDGFSVYSDSFSSSFPMNNYTPEELGMKTVDTPFASRDGIPQKAPHTYYGDYHRVDTASVTPPPAPTPTVDKSQNVDSFAAEENRNYKAEGTQFIGSFNKWASNNVGIILISCVIAYSLIKFGARSTNNQS